LLDGAFADRQALPVGADIGVPRGDLLRQREAAEAESCCGGMGIAEFIIGPARGRTRWLNPSYGLCRSWRSRDRNSAADQRSEDK
jgi:hypothetical protein